MLWLVILLLMDVLGAENQSESVRSDPVKSDGTVYDIDYNSTSIEKELTSDIHCFSADYYQHIEFDIARSFKSTSCSTIFDLDTLVSDTEESTSINFLTESPAVAITPVLPLLVPSFREEIVLTPSLPTPSNGITVTCLGMWANLCQTPLIQLDHASFEEITSTLEVYELVSSANMVDTANVLSATISSPVHESSSSDSVTPSVDVLSSSVDLMLLNEFVEKSSFNKRDMTKFMLPSELQYFLIALSLVSALGFIIACLLRCKRNKLSATITNVSFTQARSPIILKEEALSQQVHKHLCKCTIPVVLEVDAVVLKNHETYASHELEPENFFCDISGIVASSTSEEMTTSL